MKTYLIKKIVCWTFILTFVLLAGIISDSEAIPLPSIQVGFEDADDPAVIVADP